MAPFHREYLVFATILAMGVVSCSGGGGGGGTRQNTAPDAIPTLLGATWVGESATPRAGDRLYLFISEDVTPASGQTLDDADVTIAGGTLGAIEGPPTLENPRTLVIVLGTGTSLVPGTSTIDFAATNDAVKDLSGNLAEASAPRVISAGDGDAPVVDALTLSGVDALLNGTGAAGGTLQVPTSGFTIDVRHSDPNGTIDTTRTVVVASVAVSIAGTPRQAGLTLTDGLTQTGDSATASFTAPDTVGFPDGAFELTVYVFDQSGMISAPATFLALARTASDDVRPFEQTTNASQVWFIDITRDIESYSVNVLDFATPARVHGAANNQPDLVDILYILGLQSETPIADVADGKDSNELVLGSLQSDVLDHLNSLYQGANITFTFTRPGTWPGGTSHPYQNVGFSQISLSGAEDPSGRSGTFGVALFNPNNTAQEDNTLTNFAGSQRLGVFMHTIVNDGLTAHPTTLFRTTFDPFTPARSGTPIGDDAADGLRLTGALVDGRTTDIENAIQRFARFAAVILAHECGHSVGLVANGPMPTGLYGNDATNFPVFPASAADGHIKMPTSHFPGVSENVMTPGFDFDSALAPQTRFNSLNTAYLRERVIVNGI